MIYYRILEALKVGISEPVWSFHWAQPKTLDQAKKDIENLRKNNSTKIFKLVKMEDVEL